MFWYCHKRGREVRLEKERLLTETEIEALDKPSSSYEPLTTTAVPGAPMDQVRAGIDYHEGSQPSSSYAPGGSLAKELAKEENPNRGEAAYTMSTSQGP